MDRRPAGRTDGRTTVDEIARLKWMGSLVRAALIGNDDVACLLWMDASNRVRIHVAEESLTVGCDSTCELVLPSPGVAPRHCLINRGESGARIYDLGSANGTQLNGESIGPDDRSLHDGDMIELGGVPVAYVG
jgi:hypothetical protein